MAHLGSLQICFSSLLFLPASRRSGALSFLFCPFDLFQAVPKLGKLQAWVSELAKALDSQKVLC